MTSYKFVSVEEIRKYDLDDEEASTLEDFRSGRSKVTQNLALSDDEDAALLILAAKNFFTQNKRHGGERLAEFEYRFGVAKRNVYYTPYASIPDLSDTMTLGV